MSINRVASGVVLVLILAHAALAGDKGTKPLQTVLNHGNYNLIYPATSDVFAGGFLVSDSKHSSFYGLPPGVPTPDTSPVSATWGKEDISSSFSLQALVSGLGKIVNAGAKFDKSNKLTLAQISATGSEITNPALSDLNNNQIVMTQVNQWINQHYRVYVVHTALKTSSISVTSSGSWDVGTAFGTALPQCSASATSSGGATTANNNASPAANNASSTANDASPSANKNASPATKTPATNGPTASLQACSNSNASLSLTTDTPLVFAASLNPIVLINGKLQLGPVLTLVTGGAVRESEAQPPADTAWITKPWPNSK